MSVKGINEKYDFTEEQWQTIAEIFAKRITEREDKMLFLLDDLDKKLEEATKMVADLKIKLELGQ